jgi:two-component system sensor histidine kinase KdpD
VITNHVPQIMSNPLYERETERPTPEEMLARIQAEEHEAEAEVEIEVESPSTSPGDGRLRIFLGAAPGVGKTYEMLVEAREEKAKGVDVVVGFIETYGRPQTAAQIGDLDIVPRKRIEYQGVILEEMDTEAVIARSLANAGNPGPQIALVDELAHTNAHGSRHKKRYEDVLDLLNAGINVWTTMNVQHIESLHTNVETITGVAVRETVPDWIVDRADEVSLVDVSVEEMHRRMKEGNIYPPAQARMALQNFFRKGNLTALRELALRRTAENVDVALERYMAEHAIQDPWAATERIMVAVSCRPLGKDLIRRGWNLARGLKAPLIAAYVRRPGTRTTPEQETGLKANLELAEDLGAEIVVMDGNDVAAELARLARERHITQIVVGKAERGSQRGALKSLFRPSLPQRLAGMVTQDVHLVSPITKGRVNRPVAQEPADTGDVGNVEKERQH